MSYIVKRKNKLNKTKKRLFRSQADDASKTFHTSRKSVKQASDAASAVNKQTESSKTTIKRR